MKEILIDTVSHDIARVAKKYNLQLTLTSILSTTSRSISFLDPSFEVIRYPMPDDRGDCLGLLVLPSIVDGKREPLPMCS